MAGSIATIAELGPADLLSAERGLHDLNVPTLIVWGTDDENIVWGTLDDENIVWGTMADENNIVWGTWDDSNIVWGTSQRDPDIIRADDDGHSNIPTATTDSTIGAPFLGGFGGPRGR